MCFFDGQGCGYANGNTDECRADALEFSYVWFKEEARTDVVVATEVLRPLLRMISSAKIIKIVGLGTLLVLGAKDLAR